MRVRSLASAGAALVVLFATAASGDSFALDPPPTFGVDPGAEADVVPGEIAVDVRDDASDAAIADLATSNGIVLRPNSAWSDAHDRMEVADVDPAREAAILEALSRDPRVEGAEPMALYRASFVPNDPLYADKQWHLQRVGAESAWHYSCGRGVTVAVIDTGVACFDEGPFARGSDLAGTRCEGGYNFVERSAPPHDDHGHGTHVAGTIAQTTHNGVGAAGLAYCATLMPIKVLSKQGFGTVASIAEGIRFAADEGAQVINLSLGGPIRSRILESAVEHAIAKGVVIVAAAGNSGREVGYPAAYPGVIAVSATDPEDKVAWFSSRGPEIAIAAPGVAVTQQTICNGGRDRCEIFGTFNGTSMASPHVAGVAAMVEALGVTAPASVRAALASSARPKAAPRRSSTGRGSSTRARRSRACSGPGSRRGWRRSGCSRGRWLGASAVAAARRRGRWARSSGRSGRRPGSHRGLLSSACLRVRPGRAGGSTSPCARSASGTSRSSARAPTAGCSWRAPCRPSRSRRWPSRAGGSVRSSAAWRWGARPLSRSWQSPGTSRSRAGRFSCVSSPSPTWPPASGWVASRSIRSDKVCSEGFRTTR